MSVPLPFQVSDSASQANFDVVSNSLSAVVRMLFSGSGSPENVVSAPVGCLYLRRDGGAGTSLYVKESGTGTTGWRAV